MPSITGIELGPDSCVLVRARQRADGIEVSAVHQIERSAWPASDAALAATLRRWRKTKHFPRRAHVVAWGLSEPAPHGDQLVRALLKPLADAGFRVERVLTPPEALAEVARTRPRGRGVAAAWIAINVYGAAIAVVRDGVLLFGRAFDWTYTAGASSPRADMLQRYSLVAHLAPEVRQGMTLARSAHGAIVESAITCGDLPDLRSLTMPLIEELDLEVETLDSTEGLVARRGAQADRFAELAPAIRLATAAVTAPAAKGRKVTPLARVAAAAIIVAGVGYLGYRYWPPGSLWPAGGRAVEASRTGPTAPAGTPPAIRPQAKAAPPAPAAQTSTSASPPVATPATPVANPGSPVTSGPPSAAPPPPARAPQSAASWPPIETPQAAPAPETAKPAPTRVTPPAIQVAGRTAAPPPQPAGTTAEARTQEPERTAGDPLVDPVTTRADIPRRKPVPLKASLPAVESILVASDRRVAVIDGRIVTVGDQIGPRVVAGIERDAVVLEEPSGYRIRIPIRRGRGVE